MISLVRRNPVPKNYLFLHCRADLGFINLALDDFLTEAARNPVPSRGEKRAKSERRENGNDGLVPSLPRSDLRPLR